jgi:hypothetical protein
MPCHYYIAFDQDRPVHLYKNKSTRSPTSYLSPTTVIIRLVVSRDITTTVAEAKLANISFPRRTII